MAEEDLRPCINHHKVAVVGTGTLGTRIAGESRLLGVATAAAHCVGVVWCEGSVRCVDVQYASTTLIR